MNIVIFLDLPAHGNYESTSGLDGPLLCPNVALVNVSCPQALMPSPRHRTIAVLVVVLRCEIEFRFCGLPAGLGKAAIDCFSAHGLFRGYLRRVKRTWSM